MAKILVVGAGPAGCTTAYRLMQQGHDVEVFEASSVIGGRTYTLAYKGFLFDTAAIFTMSNYHRTWALLRELNLERNMQPWRAHTELVEGDKRYQLRYDKPLSNLKLPCVPFTDKLRLIKASVKELLSPKVDAFDGNQLAAIDGKENLEQWARRVLGDTSYEYIVKPNHDMLYAAPPSALSPAFQRAAMQSAVGFSLSVPRDGMGALCAELATRLTIQTKSPVSAIRVGASGVELDCLDASHSGDAVVIATDATIAAQLLNGNVTKTIIDRLNATPYIEYAQATMAYDSNPWPELSHSMLVPVGKGERAINALVVHSRRNPASIPPGAQSLGFYYNSQAVAAHTDEELLVFAKECRDRLLGSANQPPCFERVFRYPRGLTIPAPGHYRQLATVRHALPERIKLAGDYFAQAGVEAAVLSAEQAARELSATLS